MTTSFPFWSTLLTVHLILVLVLAVKSFMIWPRVTMAVALHEARVDIKSGREKNSRWVPVVKSPVRAIAYILGSFVVFMIPVTLGGVYLFLRTEGLRFFTVYTQDDIASFTAGVIQSYGTPDVEADFNRSPEQCLPPKADTSKRSKSTREPPS